MIIQCPSNHNSRESEMSAVGLALKDHGRDRTFKGLPTTAAPW